MLSIIFGQQLAIAFEKFFDVLSTVQNKTSNNGTGKTRCPSCEGERSHWCKRRTISIHYNNYNNYCNTLLLDKLVRLFKIGSAWFELCRIHECFVESNIFIGTTLAMCIPFHGHSIYNSRTSFWSPALRMIKYPTQYYYLTRVSHNNIITICFDTWEYSYGIWQ